MLNINSLNLTDDPYVFDTDENGCPVFTQKNILFLSALIKQDSVYNATEDVLHPEYNNTYAAMLKDGLPRDRDKLIDIVKSIDKINSTHLASEGRSGGNKGIEKAVDKILAINNLELRLKARDDKLVNEIAQLENKNNFSFATKFCAYVSIFAYGADNYCIYDTVVQEILPYYAFLYTEYGFYKDYYKINRYKNKQSRVEELCRGDYEKYRRLVDRIITGIKTVHGIDVPYKVFDLMLWYNFKGSDKKINNMMQNLP